MVKLCVPLVYSGDRLCGKLILAENHGNLADMRPNGDASVDKEISSMIINCLSYIEKDQVIMGRRAAMNNQH